MKIESVCVLGGTGFVGRHLVNRLNSAGKHVRVLTRRRERHRELLVLPNVELIDADVHDSALLDRHFANCDAVINLIGILNEKGFRGAGFRYAHVDLARKVLDACKQQGVRRLLHMSALGADQGSGASHYLRTKGEAENHLHTFHGPKLAVTSFRPAVMFGPGDGLFNRFASLLAITPVFPVACPKTRFAPVHVGDVAQRLVDALDDRDTFDKRFDLCGPEIWTMMDIVRYARDLRGYRRVLLPLPDWAARLQATVFQFVPGKPFSLDNYRSLQHDNVCPGGGNCPTPVDAVVPSYLGDAGRQDRLQELRRDAGRQRIPREDPPGAAS